MARRTKTKKTIKKINKIEKIDALIVPVAFIVIGIILGGIVVFTALRLTPEAVQANIAGNIALSKTIVSIAASGQVAAVDGRYIILDKSGDSIRILFKEDKPVYITSGGKQTKVSFEDIKVGDTINIGIKVVNGNMEGQSVIIIGRLAD